MTPLPSAEDKAAAEAFVRETYDSNPAACPTWIANRREDLVRYAADAIMLKRMNAEHKASFQRRAAA